MSVGDGVRDRCMLGACLGEVWRGGDDAWRGSVAGERGIGITDGQGAVRLFEPV